MRAKRWLEATTRVSVHWINPDEPAKTYLDFVWADGSDYSFDLGGVLQGGETEGRMFLAESKNYTNAGNQGTAYERFLAGCYRVLAEEQGRGEVFLWITWAAFWTTQWGDKASTTTIRNAVLKHRVLALGIDDEDEADEALNEDLITQLSESLWVLVLSEEQEKHLVLSKEHLAVIKAHIVREGVN